ncbi:UNVERIFIED_CONTAM: hypothetical protein GTU68_059555 [Idotea baltica]|nr:hypothetical protein [Idotea baltica]
MSGTSLDGVDVAIVDIRQSKDCRVIAAKTFDFPSHLRRRLERLLDDPVCHLKDLGQLDVFLGRFIGQTVNALLAQFAISHQDIIAIGCHGHTLYHSPEGDLPFSLQIGNANVIAELTQITTVADFRQRDIAASGQGAPLVPAFHQALFSMPDSARVILNIGGIANVTVLDPQQGVAGFDTGPGNGLMNAWIHQHLGQAYDQSGNWAARGQPNVRLLTCMLADPYFSQGIPKSTGREYFNLTWLQHRLNEVNESIDIIDVQATLLSLTVTSIAQAIALYAPASNYVYVCGGGVHNTQLMQSLQLQLSATSVTSTADLRLDPDWVEAAAFAWLAYRTIHQKTGNLPSVTGAKHATILGAIYSV